MAYRTVLEMFRQVQMADKQHHVGIKASEGRLMATR